MMDRLKVILNEDGYAIYIAVAITLILTILGAGLIILLNDELVAVSREVDYTKAYYVAEAGINHALWRLNQEPALDGNINSTNFGDGSYSTTYQGSILTSSGVVNGVARTIVVKGVETPAASAFDVGVFGGDFYAIPSDVVIWDASGEPAANQKVVVMNYGLYELVIKGKVLRKPEVAAPPSERLAYAYAVGGVRFDGSNAEGLSTTQNPGYLPPIFDSTDYDTKINQAKTYSLGNVSWTDTTIDLSSSPPSGVNVLDGIWYINGNLTIDNSIVKATAATKNNPAVLVVSKDITIKSSTIGNDSGDSYIQFIAGYDIKFNGNPTNSLTTLKKETHFYANEHIRVYDKVFMDHGSLFSRDELELKARWSSTSPEINLFGILFSKAVIGIRVEAAGGKIYFEGAMVSGYREPAPTFSEHRGEIEIETRNTTNRIVELTFSQAAKPDSMPSAFQIPISISLDYSTWREK